MNARVLTIGDIPVRWPTIPTTLPRLKKLDGMWFCFTAPTTRSVGIGMTPADAQRCYTMHLGYYAYPTDTYFDGRLVSA